MSLLFNTNDGMYLEQVNATQMAKRGIFVNVQPADDGNHSRRSSVFFFDNNRKQIRDEMEKLPVKAVSFTFLTW